MILDLNTCAGEQTTISEMNRCEELDIFVGAISRLDLLIANIPASELETRCRDKLSWNWHFGNSTGLERGDALMKSYLLQSDEVNRDPRRDRAYDPTYDA
jgi:hypothetical protein